MSNELSKATLERKDKDELTQIAVAMGGKPSSRSRKAQIIDLIMDLAGVGSSPAADRGAESADEASDTGGSGAQPSGNDSPSDEPADDQPNSSDDKAESQPGAENHGYTADDQPKSSDDKAESQPGAENHGYTADPMADARAEAASGAGDADGNKARGATGQGNQDQPEPGNRKRRRRGRNRERGEDSEEWNGEPVDVEGYLDLRDDGYGFLRVNGALPSKEDVYVSVKQVRQFGLRKGDQLTGAGRPAGRSEKNPALVRIDSVNGRAPDQAVNRAEFDELTPLFPREQLVLAGGEDDLTGRMIDLLAPIGKGSRGLIVSPPGAGKTTILTQIAKSIEANHQDVEVLVVLIDERPEEVTEMQRALDRGAVVASTFDRPADEHCAVAELSLERAKRRVELENDVVVIIDGITRLGRAYSSAAGPTGRSGGHVDPGAIFPAKRFFGAARNVEEGGSLTILATAASNNGSDLDASILEEFEGTANSVLELDRRSAERQVYPAVNIDRSSTRRAEQLVGADQADQIRTLRQLLAGPEDDAGNVVALRELIGRMETSADNPTLLQAAAKDAE